MRLTSFLAPLMVLAACGGGSEEPTSSPTDDTDASTDTGDVTSEPTVADCSTRPTDIPTSRGELEGVWSDASGRFMIFGGDAGVPEECYPQSDFVDDVWLWEEDCGNFRQVPATGAWPEPTGRYAMAYDPTGDQVLMMGGRFRSGSSGLYTLRDAAWSWSFETEEWTQLPEGPSMRAITAGAVAAGYFVVYSGTGSHDGGSYNPIYDDVWLYDLEAGTWSELATMGGGPGGRVFHSMASDGDLVYVYGGGDLNAFLGPFYSDLWSLDPKTGVWELLHDGTGGGDVPAGRIWADLVYDAESNDLVLWAGHDDTALGNTNQIYRFDLDSGDWVNERLGDVVDAGSNGFCDFPPDFVAPDLDSPERRYGAAAAATADGRMLTFGGKTDCGIINDLWAYDFATTEWTRHLRATNGETCLRSAAECSDLCF